MDFQQLNLIFGSLSFFGGYWNEWFQTVYVIQF